MFASLKGKYMYTDTLLTEHSPTPTPTHQTNKQMNTRTYNPSGNLDRATLLEQGTARSGSPGLSKQSVFASLKDKYFGSGLGMGRDDKGKAPLQGGDDDSAVESYLPQEEQYVERDTVWIESFRFTPNILFEWFSPKFGTFSRRLPIGKPADFEFMAPTVASICLSEFRVFLLGFQGQIPNAQSKRNSL